MMFTMQCIPCLRNDPKFLLGYDAKVVCDFVAVHSPVFRDFIFQEPDYSLREIPEVLVASVVGYSTVHNTPKSLNGIKVRGIRRNEVKFNSSVRATHPFPHHKRMVAFGIIKKNIHTPFVLIASLNTLQKRECTQSVNLKLFADDRFARFKVNGTMKV